ncbi:helix-turn-helix domain-containing protein [Caulobacter sp. S45]|uniref:helix-turn-helix transcriptional regulator n=1 Tax=Caulobacter sp. S45 TaxID=1641861 RepID=UPI0015773944
MVNLPPVATCVETAAFLRIGKSTLAKMRLTGSGPTYCKQGRKVVYRRDDVLVWLEGRRHRSTSEHVE